MMKRNRISLPAMLLLGMLLSCAISSAFAADPAPPTKVAVADVPNDKGDALKLTFGRSPDDGAGANNVISYQIFTRLPGQTPVYLAPITAIGAATYGRTITGLTAGQSYGIGVSAWNGTSASTPVVLWTTPKADAVPAPAASVQVVDVPNDGGTALRLTFGKSADDGGGANNVISYKVFKRLPNQAAVYLSPVTATSAATYTVTVGGLVPGQRYGIGVSAWTGSVASTVTVVWATPIDDLTPQPPSSLTLTDPPGDNGTTLQIVFGKSPSEAIAGRVTSYMVSKRIVGSPFTTVTTIPATGAATYAYTVTGLTRGVKVGIGVRAVNGTRFSTYLARWKAPLDTLPPGAPRSVSIVNPSTDNGTTMQMRFTRSVDDAIGGDVVAYRFYKRTATGALTAAGSLRATKAETYSFTFKKLTVGLRYGFAVSAFDGTSESDKVVVWGDTGLPRPPRNLALIDFPNDNGDALKVLFTKSLDDGAGAGDVKQYRIYMRTGTAPLALKATIAATGADTYQYILRNLTRNVKYTVAVCAWDGFQGSTRVSATGSPKDNTPPAPASGLTVSDVPNDSGTALLLGFNASVDDNATRPEVGRYIIYRGTSPTLPGTKIGEVPATKSAQYTYTNTGLTGGTLYYYWVLAAGPSGVSTPTTRVSCTPLDNRPISAPVNLTAVDRPYDYGGVINLAWDRSPDDGAGTRIVSKYFIYRRMANVQQDPTKIGEINATGATRYTWSDTQVPLELILYEYMVRAASSAGGTSAAAGPARAASEDNNVPGFNPPTSFTVADILGDSGGKLSLTWRRSTSEGEIGPPPPPPNVSSTSDATAKAGYGGEYEVYRRTSTGVYTDLPTFTVSADGTVDPMNYVDSGLTNGTRYYYKVRYRRYNQISPFTAEASAVPVNNLSLGSSTDSAATDDGSDATPGGLSVTLVNPPSRLLPGQDVSLAIAVKGTGRSAVCLEYSTGAAMVRTAATVGTGNYETQIKIRTSLLPVGTVVYVRAVVIADGVTVASPVTSLTITGE
ncbi:MAG: fibronectin type III domain-containing protein [Armatimonadota bacterium]